MVCWESFISVIYTCVYISSTKLYFKTFHFINKIHQFSNTILDPQTQNIMLKEGSKPYRKSSDNQSNTNWKTPIRKIKKSKV